MRNCFSQHHLQKADVWSMFLDVYQEAVLTEGATSRISLALVLYMSLKRDGTVKMSNEHVD